MIKRIIKTLIMVALVSLASACGPAATVISPTVTLTPTAIPTAINTIQPTSKQEPTVPFFEPSACMFEYSERVKVECGYLIVPENRSKPDSPSIRIHFGVFKSANPNPKPDPVIYVAGGGGVDQLGSADYYLRQAGNAILKERDFIMYNQRGSYRNQPSLVCPDLTGFYFSLAGQDLTAHKKADLRVEKILECHDDLLAQGIDLTAYNTLETAADVKDLWTVLGYDEVNLYGTSSGTRTILTIMRNHPEGIRSVILDSVFPPQVNLYSTVSFSVDRVFSLVFEYCAAQPGCSQKYPDLEGTFLQLVDELNTNPSSVELERGTILVNGDLLMEALWLSFYSVDDIALIPKRIEEAGQGNFSGLKPWLESILTDSGNFMAMGFEWSMMCNEEVPFESYEQGRELATGLPPQISTYFDSYYEFTLCKSWQAGRAEPIENKPVVSDIPALVLVGGYDPVTPPEWSRMAAETLSNHFFYEFPGLSHGIMRSNACGLEIGLQFLDNPTLEPNAACMGRVPQIIFK